MLFALDTSFTTDRVFRLERKALFASVLVVMMTKTWLLIWGRL
jgi:hypothetical protein